MNRGLGDNFVAEDVNMEDSADVLEIDHLILNKDSKIQRFNDS